MHGENYEKNSVKDKITSAFIWAFWISIFLSWIISCSEKAL